MDVHLVQAGVLNIETMNKWWICTELLFIPSPSQIMSEIIKFLFCIPGNSSLFVNWHDALIAICLSQIQLGCCKVTFMSFCFLNGLPTSQLSIKHCSIWRRAFWVPYVSTNGFSDNILLVNICSWGFRAKEIPASLGRGVSNLNLVTGLGRHMWW